MKSFDLVLSGSTLTPARFVVITRRDGTVIRVAERGNPGDVTIGADTYFVVPGFVLSAVKHTLGGDMPSVQIDGRHKVGELFDTEDIACGLFDGAAVQVYICDADTLENPGLLFTGTIQPQTYDINGNFSFDVRGIATKATGVFVPKFSPMCRTDLFSSLCQLNAADFDVACTVGSIIDKHNITIDGLGSPVPYADGYFDQGVALSANGVAFEIARWTQSGTLLTSYLEIHKLITVGEGLTLYPGCDKTTGPGGCGKYSNWINFQGEAHYLGAAAASAAGG